MDVVYPTDFTKDEKDWIYAYNDKFPVEEIDTNKTGKWMLFLKPAVVNSAWLKINQAIKEDHLWLAKVSTRETSGETDTHAIMIYTKDYTDLDDVIEVLDYLESSGIKSPDSVIHYKTDQQTLAGIYSGGKQKASIYSSNTVRLTRRSSYF